MHKLNKNKYEVREAIKTIHVDQPKKCLDYNSLPMIRAKVPTTSRQQQANSGVLPNPKAKQILRDNQKQIE